MKLEWVDIIDENDNVVDTVTRAQMRTDALRHRCTYIFVISTDGTRILAHQRAATKDVWPSRWDWAVGGVLQTGETYDESAPRELLEEVGIVAPLISIGMVSFEESWCRLRGKVFMCHHDGPFVFTDGEVQRVEWIAINDIERERVRRDWCDDTTSESLPLLLKHLRHP